MLQAARWFAVAVLTVAVPVQAMAVVAIELCRAHGDHGRLTSAYAHSAGPEHAHDRGADAAHGGPCTACCATAFIAAAPKPFVAAVQQALIAPALLPSSGWKLSRELDRPPLAP